MEAGFSRMNDLTVLQASQVRLHSHPHLHSVCRYTLASLLQGLCAYILKQDGDAKKKGVVIGHVGGAQCFSFSIKLDATLHCPERRSC